tara:strand:- start:6657 stop:7313 length:657 start_codon:yes stop_codon:yes gene_type:complete
MSLHKKHRARAKDAPIIAPSGRAFAALSPQDRIRILLEEQATDLANVNIPLDYGLSLFTKRMTVTEFKSMFEGNAGFIKYILGSGFSKKNENSGEISCTYAHVVGLTEVLPFPEVNIIQNYKNALSQVNGGNPEGIDIEKLRNQYNKQVPLIKMYPKFFNYGEKNQSLTGPAGSVIKIDYESQEARERSVPTFGYGKLLEFNPPIEFDINGPVVPSSE